jgi:hypothetical protein
LSFLRKGKIVRARSRSKASEKVAENMVKCDYCGVNHPVSESILLDGRYYCSRLHSRKIEAADD